MLQTTENRRFSQRNRTLSSGGRDWRVIQEARNLPIHISEKILRKRPEEIYV